MCRNVLSSMRQRIFLSRIPTKKMAIVSLHAVFVMSCLFQSRKIVLCDESFLLSDIQLYSREATQMESENFALIGFTSSWVTSSGDMLL